MKRFATMAALAICVATPAAAEMTLAFQWGNIPLCTTGRPNTVGNPAFALRGVPAGTDSVEFRLKDLNVPGYNPWRCAAGRFAKYDGPIRHFHLQKPLPAQWRPYI
ncbi:MAG: hypothetical protein ACI95S_001866 [Dinoroseobacter sp.]|jgi:hypothetical protein